MESKRFSLFSIYFTFFIDSLGWSIIFPIFAPYFLDPTNPLFSPDTPLSARTSLLGIFLMAFSLGQFLAAPLIGEYADRYGRRKALIISVFFTCLGMALTALSMKWHSLFFLFVGRLITGLFASNLSICLAAISDLSLTEEVRVKRFGFISVLTGFSFVLGAFLGGKLSDSKVYEGLSADLPFWVASFLSFLNLVFLLIGFKETSKLRTLVRFDFFESFKNIKEALQTKTIKRTYTIYFLFLFAWTIIFQFTPVLVVHRYGFSNSEIGNLAVFMGVCWAIGSSLLNRLLSKFYSSKAILDISLFLFTALLAGIAFPSHLPVTLCILGGAALVASLAWPHCTNVISSKAPEAMQGKILGISQSVQSLAMTLAPLIGGATYQLAAGSVFIFGALLSLIAALIYTLKTR